ncbi:hypothetical protein UCRPC4_g01666 [Phaeomoniella chlamydospora]|uniref:Uncharacterized protein n=1 Tax=Phaeomoniella chlamydospora TaxID=158046 RepID=A0A0G2HAI1_PHACM|nr:hypothetical protein UCRPC4_g01666 [Phaeomoniella chlamydospora]
MCDSSPGKDKDDELLYGSGDSSTKQTGNTGTLSGEGSHLNAATGDEQLPSTDHTTSGSSVPVQSQSAGQNVRADDPVREDASTASMKSGVRGIDRTSGTTSHADEAVGAGSAGAATTAASKAWQSHDHSARDADNQMPGQYPGDNPYRTSSLDPRVDGGNHAESLQSHPTPSQPVTKNDYSGPRQTGNFGGAAGALPEHEKRAPQGTYDQSGNDRSHTGRDAALGAGGAEALAAGTYEYEKRKEESSPSTTTGRSTANDTTTPSTYQTNTTRPTEPQQNYTTSTTTETKSQQTSMYDRAAASLTAGATAIGLGSKDNTNVESNKDTTSATGASAVPATSRKETSPPTHDTNNSGSQKNTGVAEKAAGVIAGGAAAAGIAKHEEDKHETKSGESDYHTPNAAPGDTGERDHGRDVSNTVRPAHGSAKAPSFLSDVDDRSASEAQSTERPTTIQEENSTTHGHDRNTNGKGTAVAGAGATGIVAHELSKHRDDHSTTSSTGSAVPVQRKAVGGEYPSVRSSDHVPENRLTNVNTSEAKPRKESHGGRDALLVGGAGAGVGAAAYEAEKHRHPHDATRQAYDNQNPAPASVHGSAPAQPYASHQTPAHINTTEGTSRLEDVHDHRTRDAAIVGGTGAAALGGAAYEGEHHHHGAQDRTQPTEPTQPVKPKAPVEPKHPQQTYAAAETGHYQDYKAREPGEDHHTGRDVAMGAGAGAAAYELSQEEREKKLAEEQKELAKQHKEHEKQIEKEQKEHEKAIAKQQKAHEKAVAKEQKEHDKAVAKEEKIAHKEEKKHEKELAKEREHEEKEREKQALALAKQREHEEKEREKREKELNEQREREKHEREAALAATAGTGAVAAEEDHRHRKDRQSSEEDRESKEGKEKKPGLLHRILHRQKDDEEFPNEENAGGLTAAEGSGAAGATGAAGMSAYEYDRLHGRGALHSDKANDDDVTHQKHGRNVLHKDPPASRYEHNDDSGACNDYAVDRTDRPTAAGGHNQVHYADGPTHGYAS